MQHESQIKRSEEDIKRFKKTIIELEDNISTLQQSSEREQVAKDDLG